MNYASREGIRWVVLTNGVDWQIHRVTLDTKVTSEELCSINMTEVNPKKGDDASLLFLLCKRSLIKDNIDKFYEHKQSFNRYTVGALLCSEPVASVVRREIRKIKPGVKVSSDDIQDMINDEVIKREIIDSDSGLEAQKAVKKFYRSQSRAKTTKKVEAKTEDSSGSDEE